MTPQARIAELEAEVASLKSRLRAAGLEPPICDLPTEAQLDALISMIATAHPILAPRAAEGDFKVQFRNALAAVAVMRRGDKINKDRGAQWFADAAADWCRRFNVAGGTGLRAFVAALIVSRVPFTDPSGFPFIECTLTLGEFLALWLCGGRRYRSACWHRSHRVGRVRSSRARRYFVPAMTPDRGRRKMDFPTACTTLGLTAGQLNILLRNPQSPAASYDSDGTVSFVDSDVVAFAATMASAEANGWQVDYATELASADFATLAATTPGANYMPAGDPLSDDVFGDGNPLSVPIMPTPPSPPSDHAGAFDFSDVANGLYVGVS